MTENDFLDLRPGHLVKLDAQGIDAIMMDDNAAGDGMAGEVTQDAVCLVLDVSRFTEAVKILTPEKITGWLPAMLLKRHA